MSRTTVFKGSGVAITTPFSDDGAVDFNAFERLIEFQLENQTDAIIVCGTTGEASTLTDDEQTECVRFVSSAVKKRVPVLAGAGSNDTKHGAELSYKCMKAGADAILSVTPYYNKTTQAGLIKHYTEIAGAVDIPVVLYNVPGRTGLNIEPKTALALSKIENITAIKEASGSLSQIAQTAHLCGDALDIYSGNDDQITPVMALGGIGVISVAANILPKQIHDMTHAFLNGNTELAVKLQLDYLGVINALFAEVNPIPVKKAMELTGLLKANYRAPLCEIGEGALKTLECEMKKVGLI